MRHSLDRNTRALRRYTQLERFVSFCVESIPLLVTPTSVVEAVHSGKTVPGCLDLGLLVAAALNEGVHVQ
jgi:hypothetical protein